MRRISVPQEQAGEAECSARFCPRCGAPLEVRPDGSVRCGLTGAVFPSAYLEELDGCRVGPNEPRPAHPLSCDPEGSWFCIDCGCAMTRSPGFVDCPKCGKGLSGFINTLLAVSEHP